MMAYICVLDCTKECDGCMECNEDKNEEYYDDSFEEDERIMEMINE